MADLFGGLIFIAICVVIYFAPLFIAYSRGHNNLVGISVLNLFLGWTLLGWVAALVWSVSSVSDSGDEVEKLERLAKLRDDGAISLSEYEMQKKRIIK
ncbi:superinfection immunity protein [Pseudomonas citronellolis]|uniref:superinfection immunity protein n=1 Tax=Pseudomonas citronellolis TaxID=53408 RepID=UPI000AC70C41|nr:superinfection immunity protein [Pseudomonas citronellolis]